MLSVKFTLELCGTNINLYVSFDAFEVTFRCSVVRVRIFSRSKISAGQIGTTLI